MKTEDKKFIIGDIIDKTTRKLKTFSQIMLEEDIHYRKDIIKRNKRIKENNMKNEREEDMIVINKCGMFPYEILDILKEEREERKNNKHFIDVLAHRYYWETKDKKYVRIYDMTDEHLNNIIKMFKYVTRPNNIFSEALRQAPIDLDEQEGKELGFGEYDFEDENYEPD